MFYSSSVQASLTVADSRSNTRCIQLMNSGGGAPAATGRWRWTRVGRLIAVTLLLLCSLPGNHGAPLTSTNGDLLKPVLERRSSYSRQLCEHHSSSDAIKCSFHDSCIESTFRCGQQGFSLGYGQPRCNAVRLMHSSNHSSCSRQSGCLRNQKLVDWALQSENCLQARLFPLAEALSANKTTTAPDRFECLDFEESAFQELKYCYRKQQSDLCRILSEADQNTIIDDLKKIVSTLSIGAYYKSLVADHFRDLLDGCDSAITQRVVPAPPTRIFFCMVQNRGYENEVDMATKLSIMAANLSVNSSQLSLASTRENDESVTRECRDTLTNGIPDLNNDLSTVALRTNFRLVQLTLQNPEDADQVRELPQYYNARLSPNTQTLLYFYNYKSSTSSCGNGLREAGERCDAFWENGMEDSGCNDECRPVIGYECNPVQYRYTVCSPTACRDGRRTSDEECDDGNDSSGDGCSLDCRIEPGYSCTQGYNETSSCQLKPQHSSSSSLPSITPTLSSSISRTSASSSTLDTVSSSWPSPVRTAVPTLEAVSSSSSSISRSQSLWSLVLPVLIAIVCYVALTDLLR